MASSWIEHVRIADEMVNVCIPTIGESPYLSDLLQVLGDDPAVQSINLYVNEPDVKTDISDRYVGKIEGVRVFSIEPQTIYPAWNHAISWNEDSVKVAILNDDIEFLSGDPISQALEVWAGNPDIAVLGFDHTNTVSTGICRCTGSYRHGGIPGFAFMVDTSKVVPVDSRFQWWYGDDDLFFTTEDNGHGLARCSVQVRHSASYTAIRRPWVLDAIERDATVFREKWGPR